LLLLLISILCCLLGVLYIYLTQVYIYWKKRGVPFLEPSFPAGNVMELILAKRTIAEVYNDFYQNLSGHKFAGLYQIQRPVLIIMDPDLIKNILVKDFEHFQDHGLPFDEDFDPLGANLFMLNGNKWKNLRSKLSPTFTSGRLKMMFQTLFECGQELERYFEKPANVEDILDVKEILARFTTDVIASCAFGIHCNCLRNPDAEFRRWGRKIFEPSLNRNLRDILYFMVPQLAIALRIPNTPPGISKFFMKVVEETVGYRERNNVTRNDFMQLLIQLKNQGYLETDNQDNEKVQSHTTLSAKELAAQIFVFFAAGFETSATTMSFCLYELALNLDIQDRLRNEIDTVLKKREGSVTYEDIQEMKYLDKVISETLRKYPPLGILNRECTKRYEIPGTNVILEKGIQVVIPTMGMHYDPQYFPEPEKFDPERFSEEAKSTRHHYAYLPFGEGPRICIGMRFGLLQTKVGLVSALSKYEFHVCEETAVPLAFDPKSFILCPVGGIKLQIRNRKEVQQK